MEVDFRELTEFSWYRGVAEVAFIVTFFSTLLGFPLLITRPELRANGVATFYIWMWVVGYVGHLDDLALEETRKELTGMKVLWGFVVGLLGFIVIVIVFVSRLETMEEVVPLSSYEIWVFNGSFIVTAEELVFRDSIPFVFYIILVKSEERKGLNENLALAVSFGFSAIIFGAMHLWSYNFDLVGVLQAMFAGIILSVIRIYGGLLSCWMAHFIYNSAQIVGLFTLAPSASMGMGLFSTVPIILIGALFILVYIFRQNRNVMSKIHSSQFCFEKFSNLRIRDALPGLNNKMKFGKFLKHQVGEVKA